MSIFKDEKRRQLCLAQQPEHLAGGNNQHTDINGERMREGSPAISKPAVDLLW